jgi:hypothetical protein
MKHLRETSAQAESVEWAMIAKYLGSLNFFGARADANPSHVERAI